MSVAVLARVVNPDHSMESSMVRRNIGVFVRAFLLTLASPCTAGWAGEPTSPSDDAGHGQSNWTVAVDAIPWTAAVEEVGADQRPRRLHRIDGPPDDAIRSGQEAHRAEARDDSVAFEVIGQLPYPRTMIWCGAVPKPAPRGPVAYYCLRYRARGIERSHAPVGVISVAGRGSDEKMTSLALLTVAQVLNDDRWHVVFGKRTIPFPIDTLRVEVTTSGSLGRFEIGELSFCDSLPDVEAQLGDPRAKTLGGDDRFECLDLGDLYNDDCASSFRRIIEKHGLEVDGGNRFDNTARGKRTIAGGIPFEIAGGKHNLIRPPEDPGLNAEEVDFLGIKTTRHYCKPHGRDDLITVPVGRRASEVFFVMAAELPPSDSCYARPPWPRPVDDIETLAIELVYADGERDFAFPYSLADMGFRVRRAMGAYVVPADPERTLASVVLHNRLPSRTFSLAAVTVNTSSTRAFPEVFVSGPPIQVSKPPQPQQRTAAIGRDGERIRLSNTFYDLEIDCSRGFSLRSLKHHASEAEIVLEPSSGIEVELGDTVLTGRAFQTEAVRVDGRSVAIQLQSLLPTIPLRLLVRLGIDDTPQLTMNLTAESTGARPLDATVRFPVLRDVTIAESCLVFHPGDWHEAVRAYRDWWKKGAGPLSANGATAKHRSIRSGKMDLTPFSARDWFRRVFLLRCHQTKKFYSWAVPIYEPDTQLYRVDDFVHVDTDYLGMTPQVFHFFGWIDLENGWRGHPSGDYRIDSYTGGSPALKAAIRRLQDKHGIAASLYTLSDRCYKKSDFGLQHGERLARRKRDGSPLQDEYNWYLCGNTKAWRDQYVESLCRTQRETGVKILYVDVFPYSRSSPCYSPDHGHEVPSHVDRGTYAMIRQLRESLPDDVAIWSEYPLPDAALPYIDGNIHYYCLDWHEHFGKTYDQLDVAQPFAATAQNVYRYIFPNLKQFVFLCGISPWSGDSKFPFFNGEALYDCSWSLYAGPNLDRIKRGLAIQRKYEDCFASPHPIPDVRTEQREVHANCFPGHNRVAWTLFNARYTTVRGPVLAVRHRPGATYHDAWNDQPLEPEIIGGRAVLTLTLHPQQLGCIVQQ